MTGTWLWLVLIVLFAWGLTGILQKLAANRVSSDTNVILLVAGFLLTQPFFLPLIPLSAYSTRAIVYGLLSGLLNDIGCWGLFEAMKKGGTAGLVTVFTALYPLPVVLLSPLVLGEHMTHRQTIGVVCALIAVVLLSRENAPEPVSLKLLQQSSLVGPLRRPHQRHQNDGRDARNHRQPNDDRLK